MIGDTAKSNVPMLGYTVPYSVANTLLTLWGLVGVLMVAQCVAGATVLKRPCEKEPKSLTQSTTRTTPSHSNHQKAKRYER